MSAETKPDPADTITLDDLLQQFPPGSRQALRAVWESLTPNLQQQLLGYLPGVPGDLKKLRQILDQSSTQFQMAFGDQQRVVVVGPANVGKSTLYNQLIAANSDRALVSPVPGTTRANQEADAELFTVVDTPGADAVGEVGAAERQLALNAASSADFLIIMFDALQGIKQTEHDLFTELTALGKPFIVVLNKMDLVGKKEQTQVVGSAAKNLGLPPSQIIPITATEGDNLERVVTAIVSAEPRLIAALGQALPAYRWQLAWKSITGAASTAGLIALTPLPFLDFLPLVVIQSSLILGIARIYNYRLTPARARELVATFGLGLLGRALFAELSKFGGPPGWVIAAAVAASTTVAMGYAAIVWFERGEQVTADSLKRISQTVGESLMETLKNLGRRKPSKQTLSEKIAEALQRGELEKEMGRSRFQRDDAADKGGVT